MAYMLSSFWENSVCVSVCECVCVLGQAIETFPTESILLQIPFLLNSLLPAQTSPLLCEMFSSSFCPLLCEMFSTSSCQSSAMWDVQHLLLNGLRMHMKRCVLWVHVWYYVRTMCVCVCIRGMCVIVCMSESVCVCVCVFPFCHDNRFNAHSPHLLLDEGQSRRERFIVKLLGQDQHNTPAANTHTHKHTHTHTCTHTHTLGRGYHNMMRANVRYRKLLVIRGEK